MTKDLDNLIKISFSIQRLREYTADGLRAFMIDPKSQDAVAMNLERIGRAVSDLPQEFRSQRPDIPWAAMIEIRNLVLMGLENEDLNIIYDFIEKDIPYARDRIMEMIDRM
jgi:uncharacterized protein with HEPN domain